MIRRRLILSRITWDGPAPTRGAFLAGVQPDVYWRIEAVVQHRHPGTPEAETAMTLELRRHNGVLPPGAVLHPQTRVHRTDPTGPQRVRQMARSGPTAVMRAAWRDPTDTTPNASRRPREITGYRRYCPLRRIRSAPGSQIKDEHITAADLLRLHAEIAAIGFSAPHDGEAVEILFGPKAGPSAAAQAQAAAARTVQRAMDRFAPGQRALVIEVILFNRALRTWCARLAARGLRSDPTIEMGKLLAVLDILLDFYAAEVELAMARDAPVSAA